MTSKSQKIYIQQTVKIIAGKYKGRVGKALAVNAVSEYNDRRITLVEIDGKGDHWIENRSLRNM